MSRHDWFYESFPQLKERTLSADATKEDLENLAQWFSAYDEQDWNGECWDIDGIHSLYPLYEENSDGDYDVAGYEIR